MNINKQKGFGLITLIFVLLSIVLSMVSLLYVKTSDSYSDFYSSDQSKDEFMIRVRDEIESFYIAHSDDLLEDSLPAYLTDDYVLSNLEIPSRSSSHLKVAISDIQENDMIRWRNIYAWIPEFDGTDNSSFDPSLGFSEAFKSGEDVGEGDGVRWVSYTGKSLGNERLKSAREQINDIGKKIQLMASGSVNDDFFSDFSINYFANCQKPQDPRSSSKIDRPNYTRALPSIGCSITDGFSPLEELIIDQQEHSGNSIGVPTIKLKNRWGNPIEIANKSAENTNGITEGTTITLNGDDEVRYNSGQVPYSFILRSETSKPNKYVFTVVVQII